MNPERPLMMHQMTPPQSTFRTTPVEPPSMEQDDHVQESFQAYNFDHDFNCNY